GKRKNGHPRTTASTEYRSRSPQPSATVPVVFGGPKAGPHTTFAWRNSRLSDGMTDEWIVRVQGKEYGPVEVDTLREWKMEGRLLPANEARRTDVPRWTTAADIPGLFESVDTAAAPAAGRSPRRARLQPRRSVGQLPIGPFPI